MKKSIFLWLILLVVPIIGFGKGIQIGILEYKGGDWYCAKGGVQNFIKEATKLCPLKLEAEPKVVKLRERVELFTLPLLVISGHGEILLDELEKNNLKQYLENGGFLLVNDDYGLDTSFKKLVKDLYPDLELLELNNQFPIFKSYFSFSLLPKFQEHDGLPPKAFGLFINKRLVLLYLFSCDIADGWLPESVYHLPKETRDKAIQFGINILYFVLSN